MARENVSDIAFTPAVKAQQERRGSRRAYARMEAKRGWANRITEDLAGFIATRDSFYLASANAEGQPYIQHRGGPPGFLTVIDPGHLAFADYGGNQQYITLGNLSENPKAFIFLMDYENRRRVKIWGEARVVEGEDPLLNRLGAAQGEAVARAILFKVEAWDLNCPQHITQRFAADQVAQALAELQRRIEALEAENAELKARGR